MTRLIAGHKLAAADVIIRYVGRPCHDEPERPCYLFIMSHDVDLLAPSKSAASSVAPFNQGPGNQSVAIQLWIIGALAPVLLMLIGKFGEYDFAAFWVAGRQVLDGTAGSIYSTAATQVYADRLGLGGATIFPYPPHALFLYVPFAAIPYIPGYFVWNVVSAACFAWATRSYLPAGFPVVLTILTPAALICLDFGQTGLIFGALWLWAFRGKWAALAVMTFKPHLGILGALSLKTHAALVKTSLLAAVLIGASILLFGFALWLGFIDHSLGHGQRLTVMKRWLFAGVGPAMAYGLWGWVPFAAAGALMLARNVNVFTAATASFLVSPYAFHYDMPVASLGFGLLVFTHWREMPVGHRIPIALGFLSPAIAISGAWWVPPLLLWSLWTQIKYPVPGISGNNGTKESQVLGVAHA